MGGLLAKQLSQKNALFLESKVGFLKGPISVITTNDAFNASLHVSRN